MKCIACISVVLLHCSLPGRIGQLVCGQARFAVPFFFAISGYYVYDATRDGRAYRVWDKACHIGRYFVVTECIYFIWHLAYSFVDRHFVSGSNEWFRESFSWYNLFRFFVFQRTFIGDVSWFLAALFLCYCATWLIARCNLWRMSCWLIPVLFAINVLIADIVPVYIGVDIEWYWISNFLLLGWPSFAMGYWICLERERLIAISGRIWGMILIGSFALNVVETLFTKGEEFYVSSALTAMAAIVLCLQYPVVAETGRNELLRHIGKYLSFSVYIFHPIIRDIFQMIAHVIGISDRAVWRCLMPIFTVVITIAIAESVYRLRNTAPNKVQTN